MRNAALPSTQRPCPWIKKRRNGQVLQGRGAMVSPALIQITVMSFIREYVSKRLRPQVVAMKCASGLLLLWRRWRYTSQPVVDRYSIRFSFHGVVKELGLGIEYHPARRSLGRRKFGQLYGFVDAVVERPRRRESLETGLCFSES